MSFTGKIALKGSGRVGAKSVSRRYRQKYIDTILGRFGIGLIFIGVSTEWSCVKSKNAIEINHELGSNTMLSRSMVAFVCVVEKIIRQHLLSTTSVDGLQSIEGSMERNSIGYSRKKVIHRGIGHCVGRAIVRQERMGMSAWFTLRPGSIVIPVEFRRDEQTFREAEGAAARIPDYRVVSGG